LPELEVADFIMHAAGRRAVQIHRDPATPFGKDFIVVFQSNSILSSYIHIEECSKRWSCSVWIGSKLAEEDAVEISNFAHVERLELCRRGSSSRNPSSDPTLGSYALRGDKG
jgi:hypothetical protein